jgi:hypothetical protein
MPQFWVAPEPPEEAALLEKCQQTARSNRRYYPFTELMHRLKFEAVARHALEKLQWASRIAFGA